MSLHLQKEISRLQRKLTTLGTMVEESLLKCFRAIEQSSRTVSNEIIQEDESIDSLELEVEEDCLKLLALHQPVAADLRYIIAVLKINNDLERIGDLCVNIAERVQSLSALPKEQIPFDYHTMVSEVQSMLKDCLDSLIHMDSRLAYKAMRTDNKVDMINREMYERVKENIRNSPKSLDNMLHYLSISRHLERIGDSAVNIAEDVIYMIDGEIIRHKDVTKS